jgi:hypothetical protein
MRRLLTTVLMGSLILGAILAPGAGATKKVVKRGAKHTYQVPAIGQADVGGFCPDDAAVESCARFPTKRRERFVKVKITDASGTPVTGTLSHPDSNDDGFVESLGYFCGKSKKVAIQGGQELIVFPYMVGSSGALERLGGPEQCPGVATTGTIKATFSNR